MTRLCIGTENVAKVDALKASVENLGFFKSFEVFSASISSKVSDQPISLEETIEGAKNRAYGAYHAKDMQIDYGFGVESGLAEALGSHSGYLHLCICAIYDGKQFYLGCSTGFEIPHQVLKGVIEKKLDLTQASIESKISSNKNLGQQEGLIGILTQGKSDRKQYSMECIDRALIQIVNHSWYCQTTDQLC